MVVTLKYSSHPSAEKHGVRMGHHRPGFEPQACCVPSADNRVLIAEYSVLLFRRVLFWGFGAFAEKVLLHLLRDELLMFLSPRLEAVFVQ
jgi:hypothetical protein